MFPNVIFLEFDNENKDLYFQMNASLHTNT